MTDTIKNASKFEEFKSSIDFEKNAFKTGTEQNKLYLLLKDYFKEEISKDANVVFENTIASMLSEIGVSMVKQGSI